ncbi:hypothetical protein C8R44DRAFT_973626 [Mycena epipterygia]|nr:hypothetical protein C8R44DRAFT_973626 [Mycena epipterygia]
MDTVDTTLKSKPQSYVHSCTPYRYVPQIPQEIIDAIVDNVEDMATFKACSLVCWAFVPASRTHMFRAISLNMLNDAPHKIYAMLEQNPQIAFYIHDVTIYRSHDTNLWMQQGSPLPAVLSMLSHIRRFSIFGCWGDWLDVPAPLASGILRIISLGTLDRLHILTAANVPAALLHSALSLRVLSLFYVSPNPNEDAHTLHLPANRPAAASPEYLNLSLDSKVGKILEYMQSSGSARFSNVRRLAINPIPNSLNSQHHLSSVLGAVETTLERLDIQVHELHWEPIDTTRLTALRMLQLHIIMQSHLTTIPAFFPHTLSALRASNPLLTNLTFVLHVPHVEGADVPVAGDVARLLHAVDDELNDEGAFGALRTVHWKVVPEASPPTLVPDYVAFLRTHLPRTRVRGILSAEQGFRVCGASVLPLLPYTSVWPHRPKQ